MRLISLILLLSLTGCYTTRESFPEKHNSLNVRGMSIQEVLKEHFTTEAYEVIKEINVVESHVLGDGALAAGTNFWSRVYSLAIGIGGVDRRVVLSSSAFNSPFVNKILVHEFIHHLHDMQLDGEGEWIDEKEFERAYEQTAHHWQYAGIVHTVERHANRWWTNIFGINANAEYIAYTGDHCAFDNCPSALGLVYRKILKKFN